MGVGPSQSQCTVTEIQSREKWQELFNDFKQKDKLLVVDFTASWCGPCKLMEPAINTMASKYPSVQFAKIDVDEMPEVAKENNVQAMPTFVLFKKGKEVGRVLGARKEDLQKKIEEANKS